MARPGNAAAARILKLLTSVPGVNTNLDTLAQLENIPLPPLTDRQIVTQNLAFELSDRNTEVKYPALYIYCDKIANLLTEKFRTFSGKAHMVIEVRLSQDQPGGLESGLQLYVDAITQILDQNRGDWGQGMYYTGGYEVAFGPVKHGGRNFIQIAKITFEVGASSN
jgi:hypothetical protein